MKTILLATITALGLSTMSTFAMDSSAPTDNIWLIKPVIALDNSPFDARDVKLLDGPFRLARDRHAEYLLSLEADRLLSSFRRESGLEPRAESYGGWEKMGVAGHSLGHYLTGCAKMYAGTGDVRFKDRVDYIVKELSECQDKVGDGYVAAFKDGHQIMAEVGRGDIRTKGFDLNGIWVPWYTIHKQMAGLRDVYIYCHNEQAKKVLIGLADYAYNLTNKLDAKQLNLMLRCEQGGMNEICADIYALTGDKKYAVLAERFNDHQVIDPLSAGQDKLPGLHANTQIPKIIGAARQEELMQNSAPLGKAAEFFWKTVTTDHTYANGGNSLGEHFGKPRILSTRLASNTTETCNTYNMLKLTRLLFSKTPDAHYMDYYEKALYNHILASQNNATAGVTYFVPLQTGGQKPFQRLYDDFTCCVGTGMENHASYGDAIYARNDKTLYVNLFIASELNWKDHGIRVRQDTSFPDTDTSTLTFTADMPADFTLRIRHPAWAGDGFAITVNGEQTPVSKPETYASIHRMWKTGDVVKINLPMTLRTEPTPDNPDKLALLFGPILLAADLGDHVPTASEFPYIVSTSNRASDYLQATQGLPETFHTTSAITPKTLNVIPFYKIRDQHYCVYWQRLTPEQFIKHQDEMRAIEQARIELEARTLDVIQPGEMQPERDHGFDGTNTRSGEYAGGKWRDAFDGGNFFFTFKVQFDKPTKLICTYYGSDAGGRDFDILVDGQKIGSQVLENAHPEKFFDISYDIPADTTKGKQTIQVKFQAKPGKIAGGLYGCRLVKAE